MVVVGSFFTTSFARFHSRSTLGSGLESGLELSLELSGVRARQNW